jgi:hypothetical protein
MAKKPPLDGVPIGEFDILATYTYAQALLNDNEVLATYTYAQALLNDNEARQRGRVAAVLEAQVRLSIHPRSISDRRRSQDRRRLLIAEDPAKVHRPWSIPGRR